VAKSRFDIVNDTLEKELAKPYKFGKSDCFYLSLAVIDALTKTTLRKKYLNIYTTFNGAQKAMKKRGFASIGDLFKEHLEEIAPAMAVIGDVVVLDFLGMEHSAICVGSKFVTKTQEGRSFHVLDDVKSAFKV
jgi:hypothetical protein